MSAPDLSGITDNYFTAAQRGFSTSLSGTIAAGATTIGLTSVDGFTTSDAVFLWIEPSSSNAELVYGIVNTSTLQLTGCVRGIIGSAASHTNGATVAQYVSSADHNSMRKGILVEHKEDGTHGDITADGISVGGVDLTTLVPAGTVMPFAGAAAPSGYLLADGSAVSRTTYATLFGIIGTTYGTGNGSTTFNLPNLKGKTVFGVDSGQTEFAALATSGGQKTVQAHTHSNKWQVFMPNGTGSLQLNDRGGDGILVTDDAVNNTNGEFHDSPITNSAGTGTNNLNPYISLNYIIKT